MRAIVSITLDDSFVIHDIKVIAGEKGLFVAMPSKKTLDGEYRDIAHPINSAMRADLEKKVLDKFEAMLLEEMDKPEGEAEAESTESIEDEE